MQQVALSQGVFALVDDDDAPFVGQFVWTLGPGGYAVRQAVHADGSRHMVYLHRAVLHAKRGELVDHENLNKLDCRKRNLRLATVSQNNANVGVRAHSRSGHTGVSWVERRQRWRAYAVKGGKQHFAGYFRTQEKAVAARAELARRLHGEFARI